MSTITIPTAALTVAASLCAYDKGDVWFPMYVFDTVRNCPAIFGADGNIAVKVSWISSADEQPPFMSGIWGARFGKMPIAKGVKLGALVECDLDEGKVSDGRVTAPLQLDKDTIVTDAVAQSFPSLEHAQADRLGTVKTLVDYVKLWDQAENLEPDYHYFDAGKMAAILALEKPFAGSWYPKKEVQPVHVYAAAGKALRFDWPCWQYLGLRLQMQAVIMSFGGWTCDTNYSLRVPSESVEE